MNHLIEKFCERSRSEAFISFLGIDGIEEKLPYSEMFESALKLLSALKAKGIKKGDELVFQLKNDKKFILCFWACILGGIKVVPIPFAIKDEMIRMIDLVIYNLSKPYIIVDEIEIDDYVGRFIDFHKGQTNVTDIITSFPEYDSVMADESLICDLEDDDTILIQFSSGSTGLPKGDAITYGCIFNNCNSCIKALEATEFDTVISWLPFTHNFALIGGHISPVLLGINQYKMTTEEFIMNPLSWINRISDYKASISFSPNFGFLRCAEIIDDNKDYGWDLSGLKLIVNGAEPIHDQCCKIFINKLSKYGIENDIIVPAYGMSETTLIISTGKRGMNYSKYNINRSKLSVGDHVDLSDNCKDDYTTFVECGVAADDVNIRITDEQHNDLGTGIVGNIEVISTSLMKEYYNDPEKTKQTFCEDGWLITGDIGAILDGKLVILGRKKEIMFLNGKNYYPSDFESCIYKNLSLPQGSIAVISAFDEKIQSEKVVLFLNSAFLGSGVDAKIRNLIADNMHISISDICYIEEIPRTLNGKIKRFELVNSFKNGIIKPYNSASTDNNNNAPENETEAIILDMVSSITETDKNQISVSDNFISLGLNSIKSGILISKLNEIFDMNMGIDIVFINSNIKALSEHINTNKRNSLYSLKKIDEVSQYPISSQQKRMFALNQMSPESTNYNVFAGIEVKGEFNCKLAEEAVRKIISRHEVLRTNFDVVNGEIVQIINKEADFHVEYVTVDNREDNKKYIQSFIRPFDLKKDLLIRVLVIRNSDTLHSIVFDLHHIISDGTTFGILIKEFCALYNHEELEPPKYQYKDYVNWQNEYINSERFVLEEKYWSEYFEEPLTEKEFPLDKKRESKQSFDGSRFSVVVDENVFNKIVELSKKNEVTNYMILMSAYSILVSKYTGSNEVILGSTIVGRSMYDFMDIMGLFVNTVVFRNKIYDDMSFHDVLMNVKRDTINAYSHQDYQFDWLLKKIDYKKAVNKNPIFDLMFNMQNMNLPEMVLNGLDISYLELEDEYTRFDLIMILNELLSALKLEFIYCNKLFESETIHTLKDRYLKILDIILDDPDIKVKDISVLDDSDNLLQNDNVNDFSFDF